MSKKLVIVESPAKAKTIKGFLGNDYTVEASIGHIRDLPPNGKKLPDELKKKWWSDYAVDIDNNFEPFYEVPSEKSAQVKKLKDAMKGADTLVLATDEDREGESISWHLLQVLKPGKSVKVVRIAFHEITKEAILNALNHPRDIDQRLVEAQEARRILDRLYGYTLSPVLWSRVTKNLSAGRVQSPAVKLIVEREEQRRKFRTAGYWDLKAILSADGQDFSATLKEVNSQRVAIGSDFDDETGALRPERAGKVLLLDQETSLKLAEAAKAAKPWRVSVVEAKEGQEKPAPPFMTTSLQQEANRKFGFSADRTMRAAQGLYEGVEMGGERVGLITYMRTDSLTLSDSALDGLRELIARDYKDCLPDKPNKYANKVRNAQEAHEAIRPTDANRRPASVARYLNDDQQKLYDLIWKRTVACQMKNAKVLRTEVEIEAKAQGASGSKGDDLLSFGTSGKQILFDGFRRVYLEGKDDPDAEKEGMERRLPLLKVGMELNLVKLEPEGHETKPPARYTDATLIKKLEEKGIGRPSTYASIISVIVDRGYVRKQGKQLIPTFKAYLTMQVLEGAFEEFMELDFTARMDDALDEIAEGSKNSKTYLKNFFLGVDGKQGLKTAVDERKKDIPYPRFSIGDHPELHEPILVRTNREGNPFLQVGEETKQYANIPDDLAPADLTLEKAIELFAQKGKEAESVGVHPVTGRRLLLKFRQGYYLEAERTAEEIEAKVKPTWISLPPGANPRELSQEDLDLLSSLPHSVGTHPEMKEEIVFKMGKFGAYLECGLERRTLEDWRKGFTLSVNEAVEILKQPKGRTARAAAGPIKAFGVLEEGKGEVKVLAGRFGPYVTDGEVNATLPRGLDPNEITAERAIELIKAKREAGPSTFVRKKAGAKKPAAQTAAAKKPAAKKPAAKKKPAPKKKA